MLRWEPAPNAADCWECWDGRRIRGSVIYYKARDGTSGWRAKVRLHRIDDVWHPTAEDAMAAVEAFLIAELDSGHDPAP